MYAYPSTRTVPETQTVSETIANVANVVIDSTTTVVNVVIDSTIAVGRVTGVILSAPFYALSKIKWPKSETNYYEKQFLKYNIDLNFYIHYKEVNKLNVEQKLVICAAAASIPPSGDPNKDENNRKILIALLVSVLLASSGVAIVVYTGSSGLLPTLFIEVGSTGINHCIKTIKNNEKFLWREWSNEMLQSGVETLVLGVLNKCRQTVPIRIRGIVNNNIINAICSIYDAIEPFSNVIICLTKTDDIEEIVMEIFKSIDEKYSTSFSGFTLFEVKIVDRNQRRLDGPFSPYTRIERVVKNLKFKIYHDSSISINVS